MGQPELESYFYPLLKILESGNMMTTQEIYEKIATEMNLSESIKTELTLEGNFIYRDRINWAKTHLKHAELIEWVGQSKWKISEKGKSKLESNNQLSSEKLCEITPAYKKWRDEYLSTSDSSISDIGNKKELINLTPEEQIDDVFLEMCDRKEPYALKPSPFGLVQGAHGGHRGEGCKGLLYGFIDLVCCHPVVPRDIDPQGYEIAFRSRGNQNGGHYSPVVLLRTASAVFCRLAIFRGRVGPLSRPSTKSRSVSSRSCRMRSRK